MEEVERCIEVNHPTSWMGYPRTSKIQWRLDDENLMYPFFEKIVKSGITTVGVAKGLPLGYEKSLPSDWKYATVEDVPQTAKDWPQISFVIYHAALHNSLDNIEKNTIERDKTGYIPWVSELAAIPNKFGVSNVYGELRPPSPP